jgi:hypothetical protein
MKKCPHEPETTHHRGPDHLSQQQKIMQRMVGRDVFYVLCGAPEELCGIILDNTNELVITRRATVWEERKERDNIKTFAYLLFELFLL